MEKIVVLDGFTLNPGDLSWDGLAALGDVKVYDRTPAEKIVERIGDAAFVFTNKTPISGQTLSACPSLKFIGVLATGYNIVDTKTAREHGIAVCNVPSYSTQSVAQFVFALLLEICHHVGYHSASVFKGDWQNSIDFSYWNYPLIELSGKTIGIIGFGKIGQATADIAKALGMKVLAYASHTKPELEDENCKYTDLETLFADSDVISLHCPLFPETEGMINKDSIAKMKDGVIIINTSRGGIIVERDLADALNCGKVLAAGCDVVSAEPIKAENPLLGAKNLFLTPHIAWAPKAARERLLEISIHNLAQFIEGNPVNSVN